MDVSSMMAANLRELQQTLSLSLVNRSVKGQASAAVTMLSDFQQANPAPAALPKTGFDVYA